MLLSLMHTKMSHAQHRDSWRLDETNQIVFAARRNAYVLARLPRVPRSTPAEACVQLRRFRTPIRRVPCNRSDNVLERRMTCLYKFDILYVSSNRGEKKIISGLKNRRHVQIFVDALAKWHTAFLVKRTIPIRDVVGALAGEYPSITWPRKRPVDACADPHTPTTHICIYVAYVRTNKLRVQARSIEMQNRYFTYIPYCILMHFFFLDRFLPLEICKIRNNIWSFLFSLD